jgi:hypothetical protein
MQKTAGHRNFGYGKQMNWAGKQAVMGRSRATQNVGDSLWRGVVTNTVFATRAQSIEVR